MSKLSAWLVMIALLLGGTPLLAQIYTPVPLPYTVPNAQIHLTNLQVMKRLQANGADDRDRAVPAQGDFGYRHDRALTQQNLRNFVVKTPDPAARSNLEQLLAQPSLMDDISNGVRAYGFDPHNVADAYAVWWINIWGASQKTDAEPDKTTVEAVKQQVRSALAATPDFANTGDAKRQEFAEALLLQAAILGAAFEQMKGDAAQLEQLAEAARQGAKASGLDLTKMTLTRDGFVLR